MTFTSGFERILCPTDFSDDSRHAIEHAIAIAAVFDASITAYHVMPQTLMHPELFPYLKSPILVPPELEERARERLSAFVFETPSDGVAITPRLESGDALPRILELARSLPADLLTLGYHARHGLGKWLLGSVTEHVLGRAPCPVLTVGSPPRPFPLGERLPYERILSAVDFSECSLRALQEAVAIWRRARGRLVVLHVLEPEVDRERNASEARRELESALPEDVPEGCLHEIVVLERGQPHREISRLVSDRALDLVVAGVSGRGGLEELLFGTTIQQIVRTVNCAVLSVP